MRVFSDRLFVSSHRGGGGLGVHRGADGKGGAGQHWGGGQQRGGGAIGGSTVGVSSTSKNRPSHHKFKSTKQFELRQS